MNKNVSYVICVGDNKEVVDQESFYDHLFMYRPLVLVSQTNEHRLDDAVCFETKVKDNVILWEYENKLIGEIHIHRN